MKWCGGFKPSPNSQFCLVQYRQAVAKGIMTRDPDEYFDSNVCQESWDYFSNYGKRDQIPDMPSMDGDSRIEFPMVGLPHLDSTGAIPVAGDTLLDFDQ